MRYAVALIALLAGIVVPMPLRAADHRDGPGALADPAADINDLFVWMSPDTETVHLAMTVFPFAAPGARFSDQVQYVFHVTSAPAFGASMRRTIDILCVFDFDQRIQCWLGDETYVTGDAGGGGGLVSNDGRLRVFAGLRNDPFFFNLSGFNATREAVIDASGSLPTDASGCPQLDFPTSQALRLQLRSEPDGSPGLDDFLGANVLALVLSVDATALRVGGPVLGVWASTNVRP